MVMNDILYSIESAVTSQRRKYLSAIILLISDKSVSFEKSVSFSDDIQGVPKTHSPQHMGNSMSLKITAV